MEGGGGGVGGLGMIVWQRAAAGLVTFTERKARDGACSLQHLYAMIEQVADNDAPLAVNQNAIGTIELPISSAWAADGSHVAAVAVAQHLHSIITTVSYDDVACTVERHAVGLLELPSAFASAAYSAEAGAVAEPNNLHAMIVLVGDRNVALVVPCH